MSRVSECLKQILSARYGKDVRQSIHDGIKELDEVARTAQGSATANAQTAAAKASEALTASQEALQKAQEAQKSAQQAKVYAENAEAVTGVNIGTKDRAGIVKGGENHIAEDGTLELVVKTTETTMQNSRKGGLEVDEIGGVCEQASTTGKNLWSYGDIPSGSVSSISWDIPAGTYTFSTATSTLDLTLRVYFDDGTSEVIALSKSPITFTLGKNVVSFNYNSLKERSVTQIQVEAGTVATEYEPYTGGSPSPSPDYPQEIKKSVVSEIKTHGVQMIQSKITLNNTGLSAIIDEQNRIVLSGTTNDTAAADLYVYGEWGGNNDLGIRGQVSIGTNLGDAYLIHENTIVGISLAGSAINRNITDDNYITAIMVRFPANTTYNGVLELMLNEGTEALPYEPYTESVITLSHPVDLYGIGDVQDVLTPKQIDRKHKKVVFDGSDDEVWYFNSGYGFYVASSDSKAGGIVLCTHYKHSNNAWDKNCITISASKNICIGDTTISTVGEWKARLQANPMTVVYELAEETTEDLPLADQIALNSLKTFEGVTYLEFVSEVQPTFAGKYGASLVGGIALEAYNKAHTHSRTVLWTNSDKTQPIEAGTVLLPLSLEDYEQYEFFLVTYCNSTASEFAEKQVLMARAAGTYNGNNVILSAVIKEGETYHQHERNLAYSFDSQGFKVAYCTYLDASFKPQYAHDKLIPYQIIGIR